MIKARGLIAIFLLTAGPSLVAQDNPETSAPFARFIGEWKLKDDRFQQVWDGETVETLSIPRHRTKCARVNTEKSLLCLVNAVDFEGHILWAIEDDGTTVSHLSHFGSSRLGDGTGTLDADNNLSLVIRFSDEPDGTYRHYTYTWKSSDEYHMVSRQYDAQGNRTGNWYGGSFVRMTDESP